MTDIETLNDTAQLVQKHHPSSCPCGLTIQDFQKHLPKGTDKKISLMLGLVDMASLKDVQQRSIVKNHFIILAQDYTQTKMKKRIRSHALNS